MVLSKKVIQRNSHEPHCRAQEELDGKVVVKSRHEGAGRTKRGESSKENIVWPKRNKSYTTTQNKVGKSGGVTAQGKGKMSDSQRISLSNLLLTKFNK